jgi:hypothetical protein
VGARFEVLGEPKDRSEDRFLLWGHAMPQDGAMTTYGAVIRPGNILVVSVPLMSPAGMTMTSMARQATKGSIRRPCSAPKTLGPVKTLVHQDTRAQGQKPARAEGPQSDVEGDAAKALYAALKGGDRVTVRPRTAW